MNVQDNQRVDEAITTLRRFGYAVVAFTPEEISNCPVDELEERLTEHGWASIAAWDVAP